MNAYPSSSRRLVVDQQRNEAGWLKICIRDASVSNIRSRTVNSLVVVLEYGRLS